MILSFSFMEILFTNLWNSPKLLIIYLEIKFLNKVAKLYKSLIELDNCLFKVQGIFKFNFIWINLYKQHNFIRYLVFI